MIHIRWDWESLRMFSRSLREEFFIYNQKLYFFFVVFVCFKWALIDGNVGFLTQDGNGRTQKTSKGSRTTTPSAIRRCSDSDEDSESGGSPSVPIRARPMQPPARPSQKAAGGLSDQSGLVGFRNIGNTVIPSYYWLQSSRTIENPPENLGASWQIPWG